MGHITPELGRSSRGNLRRVVEDLASQERQRAYKASASSVALSAELHVATHREGILWEQDFASGRATSELRQRRVEGCGTRLSFRPDPEIFGATTFDRTDLEDRLEALRREFPQCTFDLHDARSLQ